MGTSKKQRNFSLIWMCWLAANADRKWGEQEGEVHTLSAITNVRPRPRPCRSRRFIRSEKTSRCVKRPYDSFVSCATSCCPMKACGGAWYEKNCHEGSACSQTAHPTSAPTAAAVDVSKIDGFGGDDNSLILTLRTKGLLHVDSNPYLLQHSNMAPLLVGDGENNVHTKNQIVKKYAIESLPPPRVQ